MSRKKTRSRAKMTKNCTARACRGRYAWFIQFHLQLPEEWAEKVKEMRGRRLNQSGPARSVATDCHRIYVMANVLYIARASFLFR